MLISIWYDLILTRLDLIELIRIRKTCKSFYKYKKLKDLIDLKKEILFDKIKIKYWNKIDKTDIKNFSSDFIKIHSKKYLYFYANYDFKFKVFYKMAAFSSKDFLFENFKKFYDNYIYSIKYRIEKNGIIFLTSSETRKYLNINEKILDYINNNTKVLL